MRRRLCASSKFWLRDGGKFHLADDIASNGNISQRDGGVKARGCIYTAASGNKSPQGT